MFQIAIYMAYESVDKLQRVLAETIFHYTKDAKKASGRALGTMVEIITYYLLKSWGINDSISIERGLSEYGNPDITHNVEYSLHPIISQHQVKMKNDGGVVSGSKIIKLVDKLYDLSVFKHKPTILLTKDFILRNACTISISDVSYLLCSIEKMEKDFYTLRIFEQSSKPFAIFECKRVGIEEGMKKGPQTIEKAKQGAYVAKSISSLHKFRSSKGKMMGIIEDSNGKMIIKPHSELMEEIVYSDNSSLLREFILTVGVVSNHGNWFTAQNQNKEMKVLSQSYDWLLFLTDKGLAEFIERLLLNPKAKYKAVRDAFSSSYTATKKKNQFTKVQMNLVADGVLLEFFREHLKEIEGWFNVISPTDKSIKQLKNELNELKNKNWKKILQ